MPRTPTRMAAMAAGMFDVHLLPFSQNFANYGDGALPAGWIGATWTIASGKATNAPTLGVEKLTNPNFTTDTTGWTPTNATLQSIAGGQAGNCLRVNRSTGTVQRGYQVPTLMVGDWVQGSAYSKSGTSGNETSKVLLEMQGSPFTDFISAQRTTDASWVQMVGVGLVLNATLYYMLEKSTATAGDMLFDTASLKIFDRATLSTLRNFGNPNVTVQVDVTIPVGYRGGLRLRVDNPSNPASFLEVFHNRTNCAVYECVNGTYNATPLINAAATYADAGTIQVVLNGANISLYYRGAQVGTTVTTNVLTGNYGGLFGLPGVTFDNFAAEKT